MSLSLGKPEYWIEFFCFKKVLVSDIHVLGMQLQSGMTIEWSWLKIVIFEAE